MLLVPWNFDWAGLADLVWRFRPSDRPARAYCYAYSWGGGWGFPTFARELDQRGIEIAHAVLCDAVYRPPRRYLGALVAWQALLSAPKIVVPPNVREVDWFYQREGLPEGHQVVAADPRRTRVNPGLRLYGVTHHYMDDQAAWWRKCQDVAAIAQPSHPYGSLLKLFDDSRPQPTP